MGRLVRSQSRVLCKSALQAQVYGSREWRFRTLKRTTGMRVIGVDRK